MERIWREYGENSERTLRELKENSKRTQRELREIRPSKLKGKQAKMR